MNYLSALRDNPRKPRFFQISIDVVDGHHDRRVWGEDREAVQTGEESQGNPAERTHMDGLYHGSGIEGGEVKGI